MKKIIGKNQVIITALAIMIAVAGYLSITQDNADKATKLASKSIDANDTIVEEANEDEGDTTYDVADEISDEMLNDNPADSTTDVSEDSGYVLSDSGEIIQDDYTEDISQPVEANQASSDNIGEAVLVSSTISSEYFSKAKLSREQTRSKNKEVLMELVNSTTTTKEQKEKAVNEVIALTSEAKKETAAETMLEAKGYGESIVSIVEDSVDVIVDAKELEQKDIAQIEDIVKRKTDADAANIVITPVGVE